MILPKEFSAALFENKHTLDVLVAIAIAPKDEWIYARMISDASGVRENQVGPIMKRLTVAGALAQMTAGGGGGQKIFYERVECPLWEAATQLRAWVVATSPSSRSS